MARSDLLPILGALLAIACASDAAGRRVPNALVVTIALAGVVAQLASGGPLRSLGGILAGAALLAVFLAAWGARLLGGGDLKLAAATAVWIGPSGLVSFVLFVGMAGIPVALAARVAHRMELSRLVRSAAASGRSVHELTPERETVPLAVAIALGAGAVLWGIP